MISRRSLALLLLLLSGSLAASLQPARAETFWQKVFKFLGVSATPSKQKGPGDQVKTGDIQIYNSEVRKIFPLTNEGGFRSPIFLPDDQNVLAIKDGRIVKITIPDGPVTEIFPINGIVKLIGISKADSDQVLILTDLDQDNCPAVGVLSLQFGNVTNIPYSDNEDDEKMITHLKGWKREYDDGNTKLEIRIQSAGSGNSKTEWTDIFLKRKSEDWVNVSHCDRGVNCSHPSISNDRKLVAFVKGR